MHQKELEKTENGASKKVECSNDGGVVVGGLSIPWRHALHKTKQYEGYWIGMRHRNETYTLLKNFVPEL